MSTQNEKVFNEVNFEINLKNGMINELKKLNEELESTLEKTHYESDALEEK